VIGVRLSGQEPTPLQVGENALHGLRRERWTGPAPAPAPTALRIAGSSGRWVSTPHPGACAARAEPTSALRQSGVRRESPGMRWTYQGTYINISTLILRCGTLAANRPESTA
jgi:hypothetical protein